MVETKVEEGCDRHGGRRRGQDGCGGREGGGAATKDCVLVVVRVGMSFTSGSPAESIITRTK